MLEYTKQRRVDGGPLVRYL